jgi:hypothetical protein
MFYAMIKISKMEVVAMFQNWQVVVGLIVALLVIVGLLRLYAKANRSRTVAHRERLLSAPLEENPVSVPIFKIGQTLLVWSRHGGKHSIKIIGSQGNQFLISWNNDKDRGRRTLETLLRIQVA